LADGGLKAAAHNRAILSGINTYRGQITHAPVARSIGLPCKELAAADL